MLTTFHDMPLNARVARQISLPAVPWVRDASGTETLSFVATLPSARTDHLPGHSFGISESVAPIEFFSFSSSFSFRSHRGFYEPACHVAH